MHSAEAEVRKHIRTYLMIGAALLVFTGITVAASFVSMGVAGNVTLALIIATMKGSMVAAVFMHLNHEKPWVYGALLLTVVGFLILMSVPMFTTMDHIGTPIVVPAAAGAPGGTGAGHEAH
jgi:caa(3)-type oxidase subunit IV